jgi:hypothetical protein
MVNAQRYLTKLLEQQSASKSQREWCNFIMRIKIPFIVFLVLAFLCQISYGSQESTNYNLFKHLIDTSGGSVNSLNYVNNYSLSPGVVAGISTSSSYVNKTGFFYSTTPAPTITGTPPSSDIVGNLYSFTPIATNALSFSITNKPYWANFNTSTGVLTGTPTNANAGTYSNIIISATNSMGTVFLPAFALIVSSSVGDGRTPVPVMGGWWLLSGMLAGVGIFARRRKE